MTFLRKETCHGCKMEVEVYELEIIGGENKGKMIEWKKGCICKDLEIISEVKKRGKINKFKKMKRLFDEKSMINRDLMNANFDSYHPKNENQEYAKRVSERYVEVFEKDEPRNLLFWGNYGIGKSHLAKSIADGVMKKGNTAIFISLPKLFRKLRSTYSKESDIVEDEIIKALESVDLLILDDLGSEKSSEWGSERIFDLVDSRQGKHTIYTTNYHPNDLLKTFGEHIFSRIVNGDTTIIEFKGKNYRLRNFNTE